MLQKTNYKYPIYLVGFVLFLFFLLFSLYRIEQINSLRTKPQKKLPAITVHTSMVNRGRISKWISGEGNVQAVKRRHLLFQTSGTVVNIAKGPDGQPLREGCRVKGPDKKAPQGTFLAKLDNRELQKEIEYIQSMKIQAQNELSVAKAMLAQSKKNLKLASSKYKRSKQLFHKKIKSKALFEEDEAFYLSVQSEVKEVSARVDTAIERLKGVKIKLEQARIRLENTTIYAPFDGLIARLNISEGNFFDLSSMDFSSHAALLESAPITIIDPTELEVTLNIPIFDGIDVNPKQKALITWETMNWQEDSKTDRLIQGHVHSVSPMLNINARSFRVIIRAKQKKSMLPHGMFVTCWIEVNKKDDALLIPTNSLLFKDDNPYVYVVEKGTAQQYQIKLGLTDEHHVEVVKGLKEGDQVVTKGRYRLFEDTPVNVGKVEAINGN
jgi:RND family efflux transporter MFP subunit